MWYGHGKNDLSTFIILVILIGLGYFYNRHRNLFKAIVLILFLSALVYGLFIK